ncbi:T9SS type A sorting domain-containing protein [Rufibacter hautae]|uniref:T9SS type A sorting domain-containing protein n=1 Tax=Rufibacter hautae TaxID=2595005 RepID=A0A5B6TF03_9BACT|nr:T9SS type A sorting domain-containing protein [Rufibacter hautae]KAA3438451.1 T9SS type A sorting domain-containing protein [Rufibacter hautae]
MRKKQYTLLSMFTLLLLASAAFLPAQAQEKAKEKDNERTKASQGKQARVKIVKQEGDTYFVLDTTLTIAEGMTYEEAVKRLEASGVPFKCMGAKELKPLRLSTAKGFESTRYLATGGQDSLRAVVFRRAISDTIFTKGNPCRIFEARTIEIDSLIGDRIQAVRMMGHPAVFRETTRIDSLIGPHRFIRIDSVLQLQADTFHLNETIRVEKEGAEGNLKVIRVRPGRAGEALETGEYNVIRLRNSDQNNIIILRPSKASSPIDKKQSLKASKKSKKKKAEVPAKLDLQFFPNPTNGEVNLTFFSQKKTKAQVRVVDSQGKTVHQEDLGAVQGQYYKRLNLAKYGKGIYVVQLQLGKTAQSGKVVVQ